jgi:hypothetical protein
MILGSCSVFSVSGLVSLVNLLVTSSCKAVALRYLSSIVAREHVLPPAIFNELGLR